MAKNTKYEAQLTRQRLLDAAEQVFHARGVSRVSLTEIAEHAGLTRGAIYWHFKNKSDIFAAMCDRVQLPLESLCDPHTAACAEDPLANVRALTVYVLRETARNPQWQRVFSIVMHQCEWVADASQILDRQLSSHIRSFARLEEKLRMAVAKQQLPADLDIPIAVGVFHAAFNGILASWLFRPAAIALDDNAERITDSLIDLLRCSPSLRHQD